MRPLTRLIQKIARNPSTEELIFFIAKDKGIVTACLYLQKLLDGNNRQVLREIEELCRQHHTSLEVLVAETKNILSIFSPGPLQDEYRLLGLTPGADSQEIKKAFRRLSMRYHPDAQGGGDSAKFIEICRAYNLLTEESAESGKTAANQPIWKHNKHQTLSRSGKKGLVSVFAGIAGLLLLIILLSPFIYRNRIMLQNLNTADPTLTGGRQTGHDNKKEPGTVPDSHMLSRQDEKIPKSKQGLTAAGIPLADTHPSAAPPENPPETKAPVKQDRLPAEHRNAMEPDDKVNPVSAVAKPASPAPSRSAVDTTRLTTADRENKKIALPAKRHVPAQKPAKQQTARAKRLRRAAQPPRIDLQPVWTTSPPTPPTMTAPNPAELNNFINRYTAAYENRDFQRFARFFTGDALENGQPFIALRDTYIRLFQSLADISLHIDILAVTPRTPLLEIRGRFHIRLVYPHASPIRKAGRIVLLLTKNTQQYLVKELQYTFDSNAP